MSSSSPPTNQKRRVTERPDRDASGVEQRQPGTFRQILATHLAVECKTETDQGAMIKVSWIDSGREPTQKPNPAYPKGMDLDLTHGAKVACLVDLPYPAKRCGYYAVKCDACGYSAVVTTAGRADDPRTVKVPCTNWKKGRG